MASRRSLTFAVLALVAAAHLATIEISPVIWQDEVQIVDLGRTMLSPDSDWSLSWSPDGRPMAFLNYLGPLIQEAAYRWLTPSNIGPRLSTLLAALVAAYLMLWWLRTRSVPDTPAAGLAALFLIDPIFVQGYRGARVDAFVIALMLAVCLLVRSSASPLISSGAALCRAFFAGLLAVVAFFVWPSAIYLLPLVAVEIFEGYGRSHVSAAIAARHAVAAAAGSLLGLAACAAFAGGQFSVMLADTSLSQQVYYRHRSTLQVVPEKLWALAWSYQQSPFVPIAAATAIVAGRSYLLGAATLLAVAMMLPSSIYVHRVVYLLPYLIGLAGFGWLKATALPGRRWPAAVLGLAILWSTGVSLVARPALALAARTGRDPALIEQVAATLPDFGSSRIYLGPWEFYYAGRNLGWKMTRPYGFFDAGQEQQMFTTIDYALLNEEEARLQRQLFEGMGWQIVQEVTLPAAVGSWRTGALGPDRHYYLYARRP